jgi:adenine phosphoribosyltransferase
MFPVRFLQLRACHPVHEEICPIVPTSTVSLQHISEAIRNIPDYPKPGILFKDITTVLRDAAMYKATLDYMAERIAPHAPDYILGIEARGFILGAPLADRLGVGFIPVRKKGKLPGETHSYSYALEYGIDTIEIHVGAIEPGKRVVIVDDLLATGGTAGAAAQLVKEVGAMVKAYAFMVELDFLNGRQHLGDAASVETLIHF